MCLLLDAHHERIKVRLAASQGGLAPSSRRQRHQHRRETPRERRGCIVYDQGNGLSSRDGKREGNVPTTLTLGRGAGCGLSPS